MAFAREARRPLGVFVYSASRRFGCGNEYSTTVASKWESMSQYRSSVPSGYANPVRGFGNLLRSFSSEAPAVVDQMSLIKQLRQRTSAPIKDVKASLVECNWDIEAAQKDLRKRGKVLASKKSSRTAAEGMLAVAQNEGKVAVIELNCETDFVARNDIFQYLALAMARRALLVENSSQQVSGVFPFGPDLFEELKLNLDHPKVNGETTVSNAATEVAAIMGENVKFRRGFLMSKSSAGVLSAYLHTSPQPGLGRIAGIVSLEVEGGNTQLEAVQRVGSELAMHVVAAKPLFLSKDPYGFHMLERRTIVLVDGSVRSYFALPPNYRDFPPKPRLPDPAANRFMGPEFGRFPPEEFRDQRQHEGSMKRKHPGEEEIDRRDEGGELLRQRHQFMLYANPNDPSLMAGTSRRDSGEDARAAKHMRVGSSRNENGGQVAMKKAFLDLVKRIYEDPSEKKNYLENGRKGRLQCLVCGRCPKDVQDTHGLVMHTYYCDDTSSRVHHSGLHKALCVLMGWNFSKPPDNSKAYQNLPAEMVAINQDELILWPPHIIVHNTSTGKGKDGRMEGLGSKRMDDRIRELKFNVGKSRALYGRDGHLGITLFKFAGDDSGLREALRIAEYFEKMNRGRKSWAGLQPFTPSKDDENNPSLMEVDGKTGEKRRVLYGYLATVKDLDKVDMETKKKTTIESLRELAGSK